MNLRFRDWIFYHPERVMEVLGMHSQDLITYEEAKGTPEFYADEEAIFWTMGGHSYEFETMSYEEAVLFIEEGIEILRKESKSL